MICVIVISYVVRINPDNVATPIAASLGDLVTLGLLSAFAKWLYDIGGEEGGWDGGRVREGGREGGEWSGTEEGRLRVKDFEKSPLVLGGQWNATAHL